MLIIITKKDRVDKIVEYSALNYHERDGTSLSSFISLYKRRNNKDEFHVLAFTFDLLSPSLSLSFCLFSFDKSRGLRS